VDDAEPFYNIYGGTQDNNTQGGPSRTDNVHGIRNCGLAVVLNGDGHQPATEPGNPDILYAEWQQGNLYRIDLTDGMKRSTSSPSRPRAIRRSASTGTRRSSSALTIASASTSLPSASGAPIVAVMTGRRSPAT
jgi:hypothetical protein